MKNTAPLLFLLLSLVIFSCKKPADLLPVEQSIPEPPHVSHLDRLYNYTNIYAPSWLWDNSPDTNQITNAGATLGRVLFYDKLLSANNTIACASCHKQKFAFADSAAFSEGFDGMLTKRNSMQIVNARTQLYYFWDGRVDLLEHMVQKPIKNHIEMGIDSSSYLGVKLKHTSYYPGLFEKAFGDDDISRERIAMALAQFIRAMVSFNSKYDQAFPEHDADFTHDEYVGKNLFFNVLPCGNCHWNGPFSATAFACIGLDSVYGDNGLGDMNKNKMYDGLFKVPSLRNIALTAPYMHDRRFATLQDVLEFYNTGIQDHPNLSLMLRDDTTTVGWGGADPTDPPMRMNLTKERIQQVLLSSNALTDEQYITDEKFSDPFAD